MIVHPGSNVSAVLNVSLSLVGGLTYSNYPAAAVETDDLVLAPAISPTVAELAS